MRIIVYSSSSTSLIVERDFVLWGAVLSFGKVNPKGGEGPAMGWFSCCVGLYGQNVFLEPLGGPFVVLVAFWYLRGWEPKIDKEEDLTCEIWLGACGVLFGLWSP